MTVPVNLPTLSALADEADRYEVDADVPTDTLRVLIEALTEAWRTLDVIARSGDAWSDEAVGCLARLDAAVTWEAE